LADSGDTQVVSNGEYVGTKWQNRRVEGIAVWLETKAPTYVPVATTTYAPPVYTPPMYATPVYTPHVYTPAPAPVYPIPTYTPPTIYTPPPPTVYTPSPYTPTVAYSVAPTTSIFPVPAYNPSPSYSSPPLLQVTALVQGQGAITGCGKQYVGTKGQSRKMDGFSINHSIPGLTVEYMAHIENIGDTHWHSNGAQIGRSGGGRVEGFAVRLSGPASCQYEVRYYGHIQDQGDSQIASNGAFVGTRGQSRRCEGLAVWLEKRY